MKMRLSKVPQVIQTKELLVSTPLMDDCYKALAAAENFIFNSFESMPDSGGIHRDEFNFPFDSFTTEGMLFDNYTIMQYWKVEGGFKMQLYLLNDDKSYWVPTPFLGRYNKNDLSVYGIMMHPDPKYFTEDDLNDFKNNLNIAFNYLMDFLHLLNCNNVNLERVVPSKSVNKKRRKKGKKVFRPYHVLKIKPGPKTRTIHDPAAQPGSPKAPHSRRGHVRKLPTGNTTWVSPCFINGGGGKKDYFIDI